MKLQDYQLDFEAPITVKLVYGRAYVTDTDRIERHFKATGTLLTQIVVWYSNLTNKVLDKLEGSHK
jgi:hypothetical protein